MAVLTPQHQRRVLRRCPRCGERHTRAEALDLLRVNSLDDRGRLDTAVPRYTREVFLREDEVDRLQRLVRLHSPHPADPIRCVLPTCANLQPCREGRDAEARLITAGVKPWQPE